MLENTNARLAVLAAVLGDLEQCERRVQGDGARQ
jgi:hypothetical protein